MPEPGDPSFDRQLRRERARQAAAEASPERRSELRARQGDAPSRSSTTKRGRGSQSVDESAIAALARKVLDEHPATWTSYAELCSASGLERGLALVVARALKPVPMGDHWFRIRNENGVYNVPVDEGDPAKSSHADADRLLKSIGVAVVGKQADPGRKLRWTTKGWTLRS